MTRSNIIETSSLSSSLKKKSWLILLNLFQNYLKQHSVSWIIFFTS